MSQNESSRPEQPDTKSQAPQRGAAPRWPALAEITDRLVPLIREHYGRGPIKAKTYVLDNLIVCGLGSASASGDRRPNRIGGRVRPDVRI